MCLRRNKETVEDKQAFEIFVGPATFGSFLSTFAHLFTAKWNEMKVRQQRVSRLLQTLDQCRLEPTWSLTSSRCALTALCSTGPLTCRVE